MQSFPVLHTNRLTLTALKTDDLDSLFSIFSDPLVTYFDGGKVMKTETQALHYINAYKDVTSISTTNAIRWGIRSKESMDLIGTVGFQNWNRTSSRAEIGAILSRGFWRDGYGLEAAKAVITYGFDHMRLHKIYAQTIEDNRAAVIRLEQLGFQKEGTFRDHVYLRNRYYHVLVYSLYQ
ncbi:GNAT family N-acetyltransferase [Pseudalkalibacillus hwajinpoensis]|uniref:GNAT family N-acetyltransferase n=1 Tax=Guptibacillus hwajinpoensis TaxID=208199 RepID=A0A4U1MEL9_9BACL|nr:GNAT family protein [Pseudalkalibacillus hwajinpoensis]TKD68782.1 GNAT family N-acetyltransferase [Pseudalkalibacillus hwajinpoensis]